MPNLKPLVLLSLLPLSLPCYAEDNAAWLSLGGFSYHSSNTSQYNQTNPGLGLELPINSSTNISIGLYKNSYSRQSKYLTLNTTFYQRKFISNVEISAGIDYGLVSGYGDYIPTTHIRTVTTNYREYPLPYTSYTYKDAIRPLIVPSVTFTYGHVATSFMFIPKNSYINTSVVAVQFKIKVGVK